MPTVEIAGIISGRIAEYEQWLAARASVPVLRGIRERAGGLSAREVESARRRLAAGADPAEVVAESARALTNKLLHDITDLLSRPHDFSPAELEKLRREMDRFYR